MIQRLAVFGILLASLIYLAVTSSLSEAAPSRLAAEGFCGQCTMDDDCGTDHKCCTSDCTDGKKKCLMVDTCP